MAQTLESIKGGGGSIKIGTTGRISALMLRELQSAKEANPNQASSPNDSLKAVSLEASDATTASTPRKLKATVSADEASSSSSSNYNNDDKKNPDIIPRKPKNHTRKSRETPILHSDDGSGTPIRRSKPGKKGPYIVEVVDVKCGMPDKTWATPITNRLKKLSFSKLSETAPN